MRIPILLKGWLWMGKHLCIWTRVIRRTKIDNSFHTHGEHEILFSQLGNIRLKKAQQLLTVDLIVLNFTQLWLVSHFFLSSRSPFSLYASTVHRYVQTWLEWKRFLLYIVLLRWMITHINIRKTREPLNSANIEK